MPVTEDRGEAWSGTGAVPAGGVNDGAAGTDSFDQCPHSSICLPATRLPRVVVIGAGFAGLEFVRHLRGQPVQIVVLDRNNFHKFQPLLYQVAIGAVPPDTIAAPLRKLFRKASNVIFRMAEVQRIDLEGRRVHTDIGSVRYDYLVLATGSATNFFGMEKVARHALGLKEVDEALDIRSWMLQNLEEAAVTCDRAVRDALTNFVVVGGGPTGVELAGALAEFKRYVLPRDYPELPLQEVRIFLIEGGAHVLPTFPEPLSHYAASVLRTLGVELWCQTLLQDYDGHTLRFSNGNTLHARTVVWSAGVRGCVPVGMPHEVLAPSGRLRVDAYNRVIGMEDVFAIGDVALMQSEEYRKGHPMVAPVAIQQGRWLARNLKKHLQDGSWVGPFRYRDKGALATIGRHRAVAVLWGRQWKGRGAWLLWAFVHIFSLIGFYNRLVVFLGWVWHYFSYEKANQVILKKFFPDKWRLQQEAASIDNA